MNGMKKKIAEGDSLTPNAANAPNVQMISAGWTDLQGDEAVEALFGWAGEKECDSIKQLVKTANDS